MRLTSELRKQINAAVRQRTGGASPLAEVGFRPAFDGRNTANDLLCAESADLAHMERLADLREIDDARDYPGRAVLDCYVTTGTGDYRELETNVAVYIEAGRVVAAFSTGEYQRETTFRKKWLAR